MKLKVKYHKDNQIREIFFKKGDTVENLLSKINLLPDTVIVIDGKKPISIDEELNEYQDLYIINIKSGG